MTKAQTNSSEPIFGFLKSLICVAIPSIPVSMNSAETITTGIGRFKNFIAFKLSFVSSIDVRKGLEYFPACNRSRSPVQGLEV